MYVAWLDGGPEMDPADPVHGTTATERGVPSMVIRLGVKVTTAMQAGLAICVAQGRVRWVGDRVERVG